LRKKLTSVLTGLMVLYYSRAPRLPSDQEGKSQSQRHYHVTHSRTNSRTCPFVLTGGFGGFRGSGLTGLNRTRRLMGLNRTRRLMGLNRTLRLMGLNRTLRLMGLNRTLRLMGLNRTLGLMGLNRTLGLMGLNRARATGLLRSTLGG